MKHFTYSGGSFALGNVSDWMAPMGDAVPAEVAMQNGRVHLLTKAEFERFLPLWDDLAKV